LGILIQNHHDDKVGREEWEVCDEKNEQVKVVKKKRAVFAAEGRKDGCCLLRFVQKFLPPSRPTIFTQVSDLPRSYLHFLSPNKTKQRFHEKFYACLTL
jgi:hypothetical protein